VGSNISPPITVEMILFLKKNKICGGLRTLPEPIRISSKITEMKEYTKDCRTRGVNEVFRS
jgi:hypothetical protein